MRRALKLQTLTVGSDVLAERSSSDEDEPMGAAAEEEGELAPSSFEKAVAAAQAAAKKEVAMSFVRAMHLKGVGMGLDPALQAGEWARCAALCHAVLHCAGRSLAKAVASKTEEGKVALALYRTAERCKWLVIEGLLGGTACVLGGPRVFSQGEQG